ncbi:hypothetical protein GQ54DRAFT_223120 [Martensiomyces pterosporus]|nr:hypothetical protein GQ54DRAFT_223120 [Martensiomyces pterosporus]
MSSKSRRSSHLDKGSLNPAGSGTTHTRQTMQRHAESAAPAANSRDSPLPENTATTRLLTDGPSQLPPSPLARPSYPAQSQPQPQPQPQPRLADPDDSERSLVHSPALTIDTDSFSSIRPHIRGSPGARVMPSQYYAPASPAHSSPHTPELPQQPQASANEQPTASALNASTREHSSTPHTPITDASPLPSAHMPDSSGNGANAERGLRGLHGVRVQLSDRGNTQHKIQRRKAANSPMGITRSSSLHDQLILVPTADTRQVRREVDRLAVLRPKSRDIIVIEEKGSSDSRELSVEAIYQVVGSSKRGTESRTGSKDAKHRGASASHGFAAAAAAATASNNDLIHSRHAAAQVARTSGSSSGTGGESSQIPTIRRRLSHPSSAPQHPSTSSSSTRIPSTMHTASRQLSSGSSARTHGSKGAPAKPPAKGKATESHSDRPIAVPRSRLNKLQPAHRQLPTSKEVAEAGPVYTKEGHLVAKRPESIVIQLHSASGSIQEIDLSESYYNDPGYDLASQEINSSYCCSFDIDLLPDAPERKLAHYNVGVEDVHIRTPSPLTREREATGKAAGTAAQDAKTEGGPLKIGESAADPVAERAASVPAAKPELKWEGFKSPRKEPARVVTFEAEPHAGAGAPAATPSQQRHEEQPADVDSHGQFFFRMLALRADRPMDQILSPPQPSPSQPSDDVRDNLSIGVSTGPSPSSSLYVALVSRTPNMLDERGSPALHQPAPSDTGVELWGIPLTDSIAQAHHPQPRPEEPLPTSAGASPADRLCEIQAECPSPFQRPQSSLRFFSDGRPKSTSSPPPQQAWGGHTSADATLPCIGERRGRSATVGYDSGLKTAAARLERGAERRASMPAAGGRRRVSRRSRRRSGSSSSKGKKCSSVPSGSPTTTLGTEDQTGRRAAAIASAGHEQAGRNTATQLSGPVQRASKGSKGSKGSRGSRGNSRRSSQRESTSNHRPLPPASIGHSIVDEPAPCCGPMVSGTPSSRWLFTRKRHHGKGSPHSVAQTQAHSATTAAGGSFLPSVNSSWGHLYRQRPASMETSRRSGRLRDTVAYPLRLGYNCILWWFAPCVTTARECRAICA